MQDADILKENPSGTRDGAPRTGMVAAVMERLREEILSGALPAGTQLRQDHIAAAHGVSHIPVREAFRRLEADGLVTTIPRRGAFVSRMSGEDAREITEMRVALECLAVRLSVPRAPRTALDAAADALRIAGRSNEISDWSEMNLQFHRALYAACGRPRLLATIEGLWRQVDRYLRLVFEISDYQGKSHAEHLAILDAYRHGDVDAAEKLVAAHIEEAGDVLAAAFDRPPPSG
jgi:DNA-binding GntR family transcriptional regulator